MECKKCCFVCQKFYDKVTRILEDNTSSYDGFLCDGYGADVRVHEFDGFFVSNSSLQ
jgi:hypothetical protein